MAAANEMAGAQKAAHDSVQHKEVDSRSAPPPASATVPPLSKESRDSDPETKHHDPAFRTKWADGDPENPFNFPARRKVSILLQMGLLALVGSFGASVPAPAQTYIAAELDVSLETTVLVVALFVLGFALGPTVWAPVGEVYGRKVSMLPAIFILALFSIGSATSKTAASLFITRFFGGLFASAPISNVAAAIGDFYTPKQRGFPMALYAVCVAGGPCLGPIVGAAITVNPHMGWRWTLYVLAILAVAVVALTAVALPETYHPVLLKRRAQRLRKQGDSRYWHPQEEETISLENILTKYVSRPLRMLFLEPMCACIAVYASFLYGLMFFLLQAIPIVFYEQRGYSLVSSSLPFLGPVVGILCAFWINLANQPLYTRAVEKNKGRPVPEARLPPMLLGGVLFSAGVFWFGWTAAPKYSWALPTTAGGFIGAGFNITFQQCLNFLADTYGPKYAASAIAANTFLRSLLACALPLVAKPLFSNLGVGPGCSVLGAISCLAIPAPLVFMRYGKRLRKKSEFALVFDD